VRMTNLGASFPAAMEALSQRIGTDDVNLVVTTITVQYQIGGNLADTLDSVGETVRDRLRIQRQIRVLTAQQRLTGYLLAGLPLLLAFAFSLLSPGFFEPFTRPGWMILPGAAALMQVLGFLAMRRIVDIEV
jgi:tight adherence protein B